MKRASHGAASQNLVPQVEGQQGFVLRDWVLTGQVTCGLWSVIYSAYSIRAPHDLPQYAVKMISPECLDRALAERLLKREVEVAREVSHPNIVPILAWQFRQSPRYLVMPWLAGQTLRKMLKSQAPLPLAEALWIARQMAEALAALHQVGWIHRDLKPENVIISQDYHVTLIDLGFCVRQAEVQASAGLPVAGTPSYLAPEWFLPGYRPDGRADLFSLGLVLYEMLTGKRPYRVTNRHSLPAVHRSGRYASIRKVAPQLPEEITQLVARLLARVPVRRPSSAESVCEALRRLEIEFFTDRCFSGLGTAIS